MNPERDGTRALVQDNKSERESYAAVMPEQRTMSGKNERVSIGGAERPVKSR